MVYLIPLIGILALWQGLAVWGGVPVYKLPPPIDIAKGLRDLAVIGMPPGRLLHNHVAWSLCRVFTGFVAAVVLAVPLGLVLGWSRRLQKMVWPLLEILRPIPPLAWIPISILWFGIGLKSAAFIIFLGIFFPSLMNTVSGVRSIDPIYIEAAQTLNAGEKDIFLKVLIPGALPLILVGIRIGIGIGWMTLVAAEFAGIKSGYGLGYMIMTARDIQRPDEIIAGMLVIGFMGLFIDSGFHRLEKKLMQWQPVNRQMQ